MCQHRRMIPRHYIISQNVFYKMETPLNTLPFINPLLPEFFFFFLLIVATLIGNFFDDHFLFKIEILAIRDEFVS